MKDERSCWTEVTDIMAVDEIRLDRRTSDWFDNSPHRVLNQTSYYKFAAKIIGRQKRVLDIGCGDGLGTWILAAECGAAVGLDADESAVAVASSNWTDDRVEFLCADYCDPPAGPFGGVVSLDALTSLPQQDVDRFLARVARTLAHDGIAVLGAAHFANEQYADESRTASPSHYSGERLETEMRRHFRHVFMFGANDQIVRTGFSPWFTHLFAVGCQRNA